MNTITKLQHLAQTKGIQYGLDRITQAADKLGNPQKNLPAVIHIAGTNGKGSTTHFLAQMALQAELSVGTYTSPHIYSYTERIQHNLTPISENRFEELFLKLENTDLPPLTEFELLTLMAFLEFEETQPDLIILETGLGGRLDATNICDPSACIITQIGIDHEDYLGNGIEKIATEKAGIIKKGVPVFTPHSQNSNALHVIKEIAKKRDAKLIITNNYKKDANSKNIKKNNNEQNNLQPLATPSNNSLNKQNPSLLPIYQLENLSLALSCFDAIFPNNTKTIQPENLTPPFGRFTIKETPGQTIILDVCHNPLGFSVLIECLKEKFPNIPPTFIIGMQKSKDINQVLEFLKPISNEIYLNEFDPSICWTFNNLHPKYPELKKWENNSLPTDPVIVFAGSFYFIETLNI